MNYNQAIALRRKAEQNTDPGYYIIAAEAFTQLNMAAAAQRCRDRAEYYRGLCE